MPTPPRVDFHAFTCRFPGLVRRITTSVVLTEAFDPLHPPSPLPGGHQTVALWDTGATRSVITPSTARALGIASVGPVEVQHAGGRTRSPSYMVNFMLPNGVAVVGVRVTECAELVNGFGAIIGMDIISQADFAITNVNAVTTMSFRIPSVAEVDYVAEAQRIKSGGVGRNDPCPCGSGRKFKQCHGQRA